MSSHSEDIECEMIAYHEREGSGTHAGNPRCASGSLDPKLRALLRLQHKFNALIHNCATPLDINTTQGSCATLFPNRHTFIIKHKHQEKYIYISCSDVLMVGGLATKTSSYECDNAGKKIGSRQMMLTRLPLKLTEIAAIGMWRSIGSMAEISEMEMYSHGCTNNCCVYCKENSDEEIRVEGSNWSATVSCFEFDNLFPNSQHGVDREI
jgi:hypothetical protein